MGLSDQPFEVMCPDCGGMLKVDPVSRSVIAHTPAPRKKMFEDFGAAAKALKEREAKAKAVAKEREIQRKAREKAAIEAKKQREIDAKRKAIEAEKQRKLREI